MRADQKARKETKAEVNTKEGFATKSIDMVSHEIEAGPSGEVGDSNKENQNSHKAPKPRRNNKRKQPSGDGPDQVLEPSIKKPKATVKSVAEGDDSTIATRSGRTRSARTRGHS